MSSSCPQFKIYTTSLDNLAEALTQRKFQVVLTTVEDSCRHYQIIRNAERKLGYNIGIIQIIANRAQFHGSHQREVIFKENVYHTARSINMGAEDCLTTPIRVFELAARIENVFNRIKRRDAHEYRIYNFEENLDAQEEQRILGMTPEARDIHVLLYDSSEPITLANGWYYLAIPGIITNGKIKIAVPFRLQAVLVCIAYTQPYSCTSNKMIEWLRENKIKISRQYISIIIKELNMLLSSNDLDFQVVSGHGLKGYTFV